MKKLFNFRIFVILAIAIMVASFISTYVFVAENSKLITFIILAIILLILIILTIIFKKKFLLALTAITVVMAVPFISSYVTSKNINKSIPEISEEVIITGRINGNYKFTTTENLQITLDNVNITSGDKIYDTNGKVVIYTKPEHIKLSKFEAGRYISVKTTLSYFTLQDNNLSKSIYHITNGVVATGYAMHYNIYFTSEINKSLRENILEKVESVLSESKTMYDDVAYAMMFGDSNVLDTNIKEDFRATGIAHILAVSGLHVSLIVLVINFILKKCGANYKFGIIFTIILLAIYSYLCNFSVSVIRASLMSIFALYATIRGKCYDNLSVLSLIVVILLLINPLELFNISFVLSFLAVLSIILLTPVFTRLFNKLFNEKLASVLALNVSVQIGLFGANIYYFGKVPNLGLIANFVTVPIASFAFIILVVSTILALIFPFASVLIKIFGLLMDVIVKFNGWISNITGYFRFGDISVFILLALILFMTIFSDYLFVKKRHKFSLCLVIILTVMLVLLI